MPNLNEMSLFVDISPISISVFQPLTTIASIIFLLGLLFGAFFFRKKLPLFSFGICWFFAGHLLESTFIPLELVFEHRNYLPAFGLILAIVSLAEIAFRYIKRLNILRFILPLAWLISLSYTTYARATHWESSISLALYDVENHPYSSRSNVYAGLVYTQAAIGADNPIDKDKFAEQADEYFLRAIEFEKNGFSSTIGRLIILFLLGEPVNDELISQLRSDIAIKNIDASTQSALFTLIDCQIANVCILKENTFNDLIYTSINNPTLNNKNRASLLIALSEYYIETRNDLQKAVNLTNKAISLDPETIRYRFVLVNWFVRSDNYNEAYEQLEILKNIDKFKFHKYDIDRWDAIISSRVNLNNDTIN
jgi:tetratricopeptide (TPR) repeat protein